MNCPPPRSGFVYGEVEPHRLLRPLLPGELTLPGPDGEEARPRGLNPYSGCEVACAHCTADAPKPAAGERRPRERRVDAKRGAGALLTRELLRAAQKGELARPVVLGTATDPWQPLEGERGVTRELLRALLVAAHQMRAFGGEQPLRVFGAGRPDGDVGDLGPRPQAPRLLAVTRSDRILADLPLLQELDQALHLRIGVAVPTLDPELAGSLEPGAPEPARRLEVVETLARAGLQVGVLCLPILPELTESPRDLRRVVCASRSAGARWLAARVLLLPGRTRDRFMTWLGGWRSDLVPVYRRLYRRDPLPPLAVQDRIRRIVGALRLQYGLPAWVPFPPPARLQRDLFAAEVSPRPRLLPRVDPAA